MKDGNNFHNM